MISAFVLITWKTGIDEKRTLEEISNIEGVMEIHHVFGIYSLVVKIEAESEGRLKEIVYSKIRQNPNINSTVTMLVVD
jgi:DNA-binding Lrp family transcriptional regulator